MREQADLTACAEHYRLLAENVSDVLWTMDMDFKLTYLSPSVEMVTGYSAEERMEISLEDILSPESLTAVYKAIEEEFAIESGKPRDLESRRTMELEVYKKDGSTVWVEEKISFLRDQDGKAIGILGVTRDISERKQLEDSLMHGKRLLDHIINSLPGIFYFFDENGNMVNWNKKLEEISGYSKEEISHMSPLDFIDEKDRPLIEERFQKAFKEGEIKVEAKMFSKNKRQIPFLFTGRSIEADNKLHILGTGLDITELTEYRDHLEKKVAERTRELNRSLADIEEARKKIDGIVKSMGDGLIVTDIHHRVVLMNPAAENLLNVRFSRVFNQKVDVVIKDRKVLEQVKSVLDMEDPARLFDFTLPGDDAGHDRVMQARKSFIYDKNDKVSGIIMIIQDVTREREMDRIKSEFITTAAHELRTPLTSIMGFSELLLARDDFSDEEKKKFLQYINTQSIGLAGIVNDLLDLSRIEAGKGLSLNKTKCIAGDALKEICLYFQKTYPSHRFEVTLPDDPVEMFADKEKMLQVVQNLLNNAVKFFPGGGIIRIIGKVVSGSYQVSVIDRGLGMTPVQVEKIFDRFYRADASSTALEGTGLGMSIVKHIIEAHGGAIRVESKYGKGTTVTFTLPLAG